ncbi:TPA: ornithine cyclodeaminase family protein [Enterococcus faecium]|uniref:ornithine cyclodeaminase family protein n=1 Tax=Enterococcus faecium TaxID=1352 RepID=UPI00032EEC6D|nr:ornithine cyclodeaminase family protein [Enterococcus faecium]EOG32957.1 ornithine cyclodeaminase/mu-crystallin family protein [Enterococcus faecium EnGen0184]MCU4679378.1 ornithine cyclodeaminase family protein [Enterococcus faecium]MDK4371553.1 ornithine cyclodeaminase family protein [Enterococcus faecium]MDN3050823.1 ornithine cyclodeaminase family protein [Enterococcus faecium]MDQ8376599.1 ornithine cyclodeaminase family protein [Enterococcus faecium]
MKIINFEEVVASFSFEEAIQVMKKCFFDYESGKISQNPRLVEILPDGKGKNMFAMMPAYLGENRYFGTKVITAFPDNHQYHLPSHLGEIFLFDAQNGLPKALINANAVTWIRTAAVSALATDYLANPHAETLALIGAGQQALSHLTAISTIRPITTVFVYDILEERRNTFIAKAKKQYPKITFINAISVEDAVRPAEIICTLISSKEAFLQKEWVREDAHINAVGTFTPDTREISTSLMETSQIYVDDYSAALTESGDLLIAMAEGDLEESCIVGTLGELVSEKKTFYKGESRPTIFDAVGLAIEDLCCAEYIYNKLEKGALK